MNLDARLPIGLLFCVFGSVMVVFGLVSSHAIYEEHSLGINVNLIWGGVELLLGAAMTGLAIRARRNAESGDAGVGGVGERRRWSRRPSR